MRGLDISGAIQVYDYFKVNGYQVLALEDIDGISLKDFIGNGISDIELFLKIALRLAVSLDQIHKAGLIHRDVKPGNIILNIDSLEKRDLKVSITDFSLSISKEETTFHDPAQGAKTVTGTPAYMSPEQTGWTTGKTDTRTDLYSLGITYFEMIAGRLPFEAQDDLELLHLHLAAEPESPSSANPAIPEVISDIILKLLSKNADDRYQTASGLASDLEKCLQEYQTNKTIRSFPVGRVDSRQSYRLSSVLYGRETERKRILEVFEIVRSGHCKILLITGEEGAGKTALVNDLFPHFIHSGARYVTARFYQDKSSIPFFGITQAMNELVNRILRLGGEQKKNWQAKISELLGSSAQAVIDVVPRLEYFIGPQPAVKTLGPVESANRLSYLLGRFFSLFAGAETPIVVFLDDAEWMDSSSAGFIEHFVKGYENSPVFILIAAQSEGLKRNKRFKQGLASLKPYGSVLTEMTLQPFDEELVKKIICKSFQCKKIKGKKSKAAGLAKIIHEKTGGNPFYLKQAIDNFVEQGLIYYEKENDAWQWSLEKIAKIDYSQSALEHMLRRFENVEAKHRRILEKAVCIGQTFDAKLLFDVADVPQAEVKEGLGEWVKKGVLTPVFHEEAAQVEFKTPGQGANRRNKKRKEKPEQFFPLSYSFFSSQLFTWFHSVIPAQTKAEHHYRIAHAILNRVGKEVKEHLLHPEGLYQDTDGFAFEDISVEIFAIVTHLNLAKSIIASKEDKKIYAMMNMLAGEKSFQSAAFAPAFEYFSNAEPAFAPDKEKMNIAFYKKFNMGLVQSAYMAGHYKKAELKVKKIIANLSDPVDVLNFSGILVSIYTNQGRWRAAVDFGLATLLKYGIDINPPLPKKAILQEQKTMAAYLANVPVTRFNHYKKMKSKTGIALMPFFMNMVSPIYSVRHDILPLLVFRMANYSFEHGFTEETGYAFVTLGIIMGPGQGDYPKAYELSRFGLKLNDRFQGLRMKCRVRVSFAYNINHWIMPLETGFPFLKEAYQIGRETGDILWSGYSVIALIESKYQKGVELGQVFKEAKEYENFLSTAENPIHPIYQMVCQMVQCLRGKTKGLHSLDSGDFKEKKFIKQYLKTANQHTVHWYNLCKMQQKYLAGDLKDIFTYIEGSAKNLPGTLGSHSVANHTFYETLILCELCREASPINRKTYQTKIKKNIAQMEQWVKINPANLKHKLLFMKAEYGWARGESLESTLHNYSESAGLAGKNEFLQDEALALERTALYLSRLDNPFLVRMYVKAAARVYRHWGANAKIKHLQSKFPDDLASEAYQARQVSAVKSSSINVHELDFASILKFSQSISDEVNLQQLVKKMMSILIENAGAQSGLLFIKHENTLSLEAESHIENKNVQTRKPAANEKIEEESGFPLSLINYAKNTRETVVINREEEKVFWETDPYFARHKVKSCLCLPILKKEDFLGVVYLENRLAYDVFTKDKLEILRLLSVQATISLENSMYFEKIKKINEELELEVKERKKTEKQLLHDSLHDSLTNLPNWTLFLDRLGNALRRIHRKPDQQFAVLFLDIDRFKVINDSLGHETGNKLLIEVANSLSSCLRPEDTVARLGGDEFAVLLESVSNVSDVIQAVERLNDSVKKPIVLDSHQLFTTFSIGVVLSSADYRQPENILRDADTALHRAKKNGKERYEIFDENMHVQVIQFLQMERDLRRAVEKKEFILHGQPFYSLYDGSVTGYETLIRWNHPERGLVYPGQFIEVAETEAMIHDIGNEVMSLAFQYNAMLVCDHSIELPVSINISALQFQNENFVQEVLKRLKGSSMPPHLLEIEITESSLMENLNQGKQIISELRSHGVRFSIDDFGTGYSSLSYLSSLPVSKLKIDKSFVDHITINENDASIAKTIIALSHTLGKKVIAEGVETAGQMQFLKENQCDEIQGYYFSKPLSFDELTGFIRLKNTGRETGRS